ncbi:TIGR01459 family HAD-type hydrolase [Dongia mobilis]|uniref:TIGR01459 family HAD-type hydrolase n=1 Tax=Dongia sp. TaxID=1977262 RepID=UPI0026EFFAAB
MTRFPNGLGAIIDGIDLVVMDLWGCMHDGIAAYPAALEALRQLKRAGVKVALVSNAPRRIEVVRPRMREIGIADDLYAGLYTSGEEVWNHIARKDQPAYAALGRRVYQIVGGQDLSFLDGLDVSAVDDVTTADFVLVIGVDSPNDTVADFMPVLETARARSLPLVCANPDLIVHRGGIAEICAGAIAEKYRDMGGAVIIEGKPYPGIYRRVLRDFGITDPARVLGIGDALRTDVAGAKGVGAKSLLIAGGIHHSELLEGTVLDQDALARLAVSGQQPDYALAYLAW